MIGGNIFTIFLVPNDPEPLKLKCSSFVMIDDKNNGIIFDTGSPYDNETLINELKAKFSLEPKDIKYVFNTHIHPDHVGGNELFKNAKIIMSKIDFEFHKEMANASLNGGVKKFKEFLSEKCPHNTLTEKDCEDNVLFINRFWNLEKLGFNKEQEVLFLEDNPKIPEYIMPLKTFGHTIGHYTFHIKGKSNDIYVTGDAISNRLILNNHNRKIDEAQIFPEDYIKTIEVLKKNGGIFVPGHDKPFWTNNKTSVKENPFEL